MTIKLDGSAESVVVTCTDCPYWWAFRFTRDEAERAAIIHEENVHPESTNVRDRRATRERVRRHRAM